MSSSLSKVGKESIRYMNNRKVMVNPSPAINLIRKLPTVISKERIVHCDGGSKALGHPRVYINLDHGTHACGYCGQTFKQATHDNH